MRKSQASDAITVMCLQTGRLIAFQEVRFSAGTRSARGGEPAHLLENLGDSKVVSFERQEASGASILGAEQQWTSQNCRLVCPHPSLEGRDALQAVRKAGLCSGTTTDNS